MQQTLFSDNLPALPDIPAVQEKLAQTSVQPKKASKEDSGILNIENEVPKPINTKVNILTDLCMVETLIKIHYY